MRTYALGVEYDGSGFSGWQRLSKLGANDADVPPSVQNVLETAISRVANELTETVCAGRTDAGVHGLQQVVHFQSSARRDERAWMLGITSCLPRDVAAVWCREVDEPFHARFSAVARRYRYRILNRTVRPAYQRQFLSWDRRPLDAGAMQEAAQALLGENDFSAFRSSQCQANHAMRELQYIDVRREGEQVIVDVQANAFLHHMVRNIVGSLLVIGSGEASVAWMAELLAGRDRTKAGPTAPPDGLTFIGPLYDAQWNLPESVTVRADVASGFRL